MTPETLYSLVVSPVVGVWVWPDRSRRELLLVAIAIQESGLKARRQQPFGPARSWWQIEPPTAIDCMDRCKPVDDLWEEIGREILDFEYALEYNDTFACAIAAGILRLTKGRLPAPADEHGAWEYYLKAWRPGKPRPGTWASAHREAIRVAT